MAAQNTTLVQTNARVSSSGTQPTTPAAATTAISTPRSTPIAAKPALSTATTGVATARQPTTPAAATTAISAPRSTAIAAKPALSTTTATHPATQIASTRPQTVPQLATTSKGLPHGTAVVRSIQAPRGAALNSSDMGANVASSSTAAGTSDNHEETTTIHGKTFKLQEATETFPAISNSNLSRSSRKHFQIVKTGLAAAAIQPDDAKKYQTFQHHIRKATGSVLASMATFLIITYRIVKKYPQGIVVGRSTMELIFFTLLHPIWRSTFDNLSEADLSIIPTSSDVVQQQQQSTTTLTSSLDPPSQDLLSLFDDTDNSQQPQRFSDIDSQQPPTKITSFTSRAGTEPSTCSFLDNDIASDAPNEFRPLSDLSTAHRIADITTITLDATNNVLGSISHHHANSDDIDIGQIEDSAQQANGVGEEHVENPVQDNAVSTNDEMRRLQLQLATQKEANDKLLQVVAIQHRALHDTANYARQIVSTIAKCNRQCTSMGHSFNNAATTGSSTLFPTFTISNPIPSSVNTTSKAHHASPKKPLPTPTTAVFAIIGQQHNNDANFLIEQALIEETITLFNDSPKESRIQRAITHICNCLLVRCMVRIKNPASGRVVLPSLLLDGLVQIANALSATPAVVCDTKTVRKIVSNWANHDSSKPNRSSFVRHTIYFLQDNIPKPRYSAD